jgi:hypothetical protein
MSDPSKHHYIPAFYLRQWATDGFLCEMQKVWGKVVVRSKAPDGTGYQKDLNKIEGVPANIAQHFERQFMHMVDTEAAKAMRKLPAGRHEVWSVKERDAWVRFMLSLLFRNPEAVAKPAQEATFSSAPVNGAAGTVSPSAVAVFEVDRRLELVRLHHRQTGRLFVLEPAGVR